MIELVFFLEELSAKAFLESFMPKFACNDLKIKYFVYEGKQDLQANLLKDMRSYKNRDARFIVLQDQDNADCTTLKAKLTEICKEIVDEQSRAIFIRIACRELESWYLAQLEAVERAFGLTGLADKQGKAKFREPDRLGTPDLELQKLLKTKRRDYAKIRDSRLLGKELSLEVERSPSFKYFVGAIKQCLA